MSNVISLASEPQALLKAALALGLPCFPCAATKVPAIAGGRGLHDASTDPKVIRRLFADKAARLIGMPTGAASGVDALDLDFRHGAEAWLAEHGHRLPETRVHRTPSGGRHYLFRAHPGLRNSAGRIGPGCDVRASGGYVCMPPIGGYSVIHDLALADLPPWPDWLLALAMRPEAPAPRPAPTGPFEPISDKRLQGYLATQLQAVRSAVDGQKHERLRNAARAIGGVAAQAGLSDEAAVEQMLAALPSARNWDAARATALWGLAEGRKAPLQLEDRPNPRARSAPRTPEVENWDDEPPPQRSSDPTPDRDASLANELGRPDFGKVIVLESKALVEGASRDRLVTEEAVEGEVLDGLPLHEDGIARAFAATYKDTLRFDHTMGAWFRWDGTAWRQDRTKLAFHWCREKCRELAADPELSPRAVASLAKAATAGAVERFAQADQALAVTSEAWDRDPWLLGTPGGTVNLRTGELRPARQADMITKLTAVAPAPPGTPHSMFDGFLEVAAGVADAETEEDLQDARGLIGFLWRLFGYCLTGTVSEEVLVFLYGKGGTGKGTFIRTMVSILGDYGVVLPIEVFTADSRLNLEYYRAKMAGARIVTASETETGTMWAESQIKEMTGNENALSARNPYGQPFNFWPQFTPVLVGNHAPRLKGRSDAMVRRLRIVPFRHAPETVDRELKARLAQEYPAILRSLIDGCLAWQRDGLGSSRAVRLEGDRYFSEQDHFGNWLEERCLVEPGKAEKASVLFADFMQWLRENNETASFSTQEFREMIEQSPNLSYTRTKGRQRVKGVELRATKAERDGVASRYGDGEK